MTNNPESSPQQQWIIVGPPGVGKTTDIQRQATRAAQKFGSDKVLLSSFTKTATAELVGRETPIDRDMIGTLHSFAFRALGCPKIAESRVKEWNADSTTPEHYKLSESLASNEPESGGTTDGDKTYAEIEVLRARMIPVESWPMHLKTFYDAWCHFKGETDTLDFTDLIEIALRDVHIAPGDPTVGFFDECQDNSKLEISLIRKWGEHMQFFFLAGDTDQNIYSFKGADPNIFLDPPTPPERTRLLSHSYRVPRAVHAVADNWVRKQSRRYPSAYHPRDFDGEVRTPQMVSFKDAPRLLDYVGRWMDDDKEIMFIASCSYQVAPLVNEMRRLGIPFGNRFRRARGDWNPLGRRKRGVSTIDRFISYLAGVNNGGKLWTAQEIKRWLPLIKSEGVLARGARKTIEGLPENDDTQFTEAELHRYFTDRALRALSAGDTRFLLQNATTATLRLLEYAIKIYHRQGIKALSAEPRITVGTIHSVKGGQSQVVVVDPSLAPSQVREWYSNTGDVTKRDPIIRQFYVAITRAQETLVICRGTGPSVEIPTNIPKRVTEEF